MASLRACSWAMVVSEALRAASMAAVCKRRRVISSADCCWRAERADCSASSAASCCARADWASVCCRSWSLRVWSLPSSPPVRVVRRVNSASRFCRFSSTVAARSWTCLASSVRRRTSSSASRRRPWTAVISNSVFAASEAASAACWRRVSALAASALRSSARRESVLARVSTPALLAAEPPVMLPPAFMTCPSSVTMRTRLPLARAMGTAWSSVSQITVRPRAFSTTARYCASQETRLEAMAMKPGWRWQTVSCSVWGWMVVRGRKVARPPSRRLSIWMAALPSSSEETTIFCMAAPSAVSMAVV